LLKFSKCIIESRNKSSISYFGVLTTRGVALEAVAEDSALARGAAFLATTSVAGAATGATETTAGEDSDFFTLGIIYITIIILF
jgi:hypothetical protein